uniref:NAC domain-containing protein n=1 Tax=Leersia perrieri TaxID=77586 RepID=A0A0D9W0Y7_9ORYZ
MGADGEMSPDRPGLVFRPSDDKLITLYLPPKITNTPFKNNLISNADVYCSDPADLVANHNPAPGTQDSSSVWYLFCSPRYTSKRVSSGRRQRHPAWMITRRMRHPACGRGKRPPPAASKISSRRVCYRRGLTWMLFWSRFGWTTTWETTTCSAMPRWNSVRGIFFTTSCLVLRRWSSSVVAGTFFQTATGPCIDAEVMERLAAGETVDEILGTTPLIGQQEVQCF